MSNSYSATAPTPADVQAMSGLTLIEFGTDWCGHCQAAQPLLEKVLDDYPEVQHLKKLRTAAAAPWAVRSGSSYGRPWCCCATALKSLGWCGPPPAA